MNSEKGCLEENSNKGGGRLLIQGGDYISLYLSLSIYIYICIYIYIYSYHILRGELREESQGRRGHRGRERGVAEAYTILYYNTI